MHVMLRNPFTIDPNWTRVGLPQGYQTQYPMTIVGEKWIDGSHFFEVRWDNTLEPACNLNAGDIQKWQQNQKQ